MSIIEQSLNWKFQYNLWILFSSYNMVGKLNTDRIEEAAVG